MTGWLQECARGAKNPVNALNCGPSTVFRLNTSEPIASRQSHWMAAPKAPSAELMISFARLALLGG
jgi:hypothetical protein